MCNMNNEKKEKPSTEFGPNVQISNHPVLSHKITLLRSSSTIPSAFRAILREITYHLGYEATSNLKTKQVAISVPVDHTHVDHTGQKLADRIALIPIMRSGLGMTDSFLELLPNAGVHHIGIYKKRGQAMPVQYYNRLPPVCDCDVAFLLDPVIGTASTVKSVVGMLKKWGAPTIHVVCVIASRPGLKELTELHPHIHVTVGTVDETLTEDGLVLPGLGDAGDRLYKTHLDDDEDLLHPSKRSRSASPSL